jgi:hypothetical protein
MKQEMVSETIPESVFFKLSLVPGSKPLRVRKLSISFGRTLVALATAGIRGVRTPGPLRETGFLPSSRLLKKVRLTSNSFPHALVSCCESIFSGGFCSAARPN